MVNCTTHSGEVYYYTEVSGSLYYTQKEGVNMAIYYYTDINFTPLNIAAYTTPAIASFYYNGIRY